MRRLNLLSSYLKKRYILFLKGETDGHIRPDEMSMAVSELSSYLRPLGLRAGVEWSVNEPLETSAALALFDFFAEFLARTAIEGEHQVFCRFLQNDAAQASFLLTHAAWIEPWTRAWLEQHNVSIEARDLGYAFSLRITAHSTEKVQERKDDSAWNI